MQKFIKKPFVVEAVQWDGSEERMRHLMAWSEGKVDGFYKPDPRISVKTLEGEQFEIAYGDWIIKGIAGEFYPCKSSIFEASYDELVE